MEIQKKYDVFKENAMGHPEIDINFFRFRKKVDIDGFKDMNVKSAQFTLILRFTNFGFRIVFQINYDYSYVKKGFKEIKENLKNDFDEERETLYLGINNKINALNNKNVKIGKKMKQNITMTKFDDKIQELNIKDLKTIIIKIGEIFLEIAKEKGYEEDKSEEYVSYGTN